MKLVVTYKGIRHELGKPSLKDFVMLERHFGVGAGKLTEDPRMEYMLFLAYCALKRAGVEVARYDDEFLDAIEEFESEDEDEAADPTGASTDQPTG